jgi:hypothetical protein
MVRGANSTLSLCISEYLERELSVGQLKPNQRLRVETGASPPASLLGPPGPHK